jgi:CRP/FNR family transcriptional regulator
MEHGTEDYHYCFKSLERHPMFKNLNDKTLASLLAGFKLERWEKDAEYLNSSRIKRNFYVILKGRVKSFQFDPKTGREFTLFMLTENDIFDVIALLEKQKHISNFKALDNVDLLCAPISVARLWVKENPEINRTLLPYLGKRMRLLEDNLTDNVLSDIPTRLAKLILYNIDDSSQQLRLINDLPNDEIASLIGSTRAVVNRHIQILKKAGIIDTSRSTTQVKNIKALIEKLEGSL